MSEAGTHAASLWPKAQLREALERTRGGLVGRPSWLGGDEGHERAGDRRTAAAVLIGLVDRGRPDGPLVLLTQRTAHLRDHAGQISFPGGRMEPFEHTPVETALREAEEEVGLPPDHAEVLGFLPHYDTVTGFRIHPVVAWVRPPRAWVLDPFEVAEAFEVPLAFVLDPAHHERRVGVRNGVERRFYVLPFEERFIWGATAGMLVNLSRVLNRG